jgi:hypothetical protein
MGNNLLLKLMRRWDNSEQDLEHGELRAEANQCCLNMARTIKSKPIPVAGLGGL